MFLLGLIGYFSEFSTENTIIHILKVLPFEKSYSIFEDVALFSNTGMCNFIFCILSLYKFLSLHIHGHLTLSSSKLLDVFFISHTSYTLVCR